MSSPYTTCDMSYLCTLAMSNCFNCVLCKHKLRYTREQRVQAITIVANLSYSSAIYDDRYKRGSHKEEKFLAIKLATMKAVYRINLFILETNSSSQIVTARLPKRQSSILPISKLSFQILLSDVFQKHVLWFTNRWDFSFNLISFVTYIKCTI